ncbi:cytochrome P450 monooxygenase pc-3 [Mycena metata]|uniref:Cytochrome P450 monooxygenase pc-3 n=1 Tax=Mycena metata TaxID=1033252 RepID=A0AAD7J2Z1_9AGAR|nr:cytochrome P450 monooxygenase pc-3 [Mycena metata]
MAPPGIVYLARALPVAFFRSAVTYVVFSRLPQLLAHLESTGAVDKLPERIVVFLTQLQSSEFVERPQAVHPIFFALRSLYRHLSTWQDKRRLAAVGIPLVPDRWPGGLGNVSKLGKMLNAGYPGDAFQSWIAEYGNTVMLNLLFENRIVTVEPDYIKAVLATDFDNYWKGPVDHDRGISLLGTGVFNTDGSFHRSMTRPFFSRERISDFDIFDKHANDAIDQAAIRLGQGYAVDIQDVASRFTLDSATEFLFGKSVDSLSAGLAYPESAAGMTSASFLNHPSNAFVHAFIEGQRVHVDRSRFGSKWRLNEFWSDLVTPHRQVIDQFIEPILNDALAKKAEGQETKQEADTLLGHLLLSTDDKQIIRDEILNILVAGRDTTSATISFAVYMLAQHPEMAKRLRSEVLEKIGSSRRPTHEDMKTMPYLRAFINAAHYLSNCRTSKKATTWANPTGQPVLSLEFDPDRFLDERLRKYLTPNPYIFLPFNAALAYFAPTGPRICIGQMFAYQETSFFLVRLLQRFASFSLAPDAQPEDSKPPASWKSSPMKAKEEITFGASLTMYARGGLWVRMREAIRR